MSGDQEQPVEDVLRHARKELSALFAEQRAARRGFHALIEMIQSQQAESERARDEEIGSLLRTVVERAGRDGLERFLFEHIPGLDRRHVDDLVASTGHGQKDYATEASGGDLIKRGLAGECR